MSKPNLFAIATSELSQDAFFAWLISWADQKYASVDTGLHALAQDFVKALVSDYGALIEKVEVIRQLDKIDLLVKVNDDLVIVIEDKVGAKKHGDQLQRYRAAVEKRFKERKHVFVYLKTLNESGYTLNQVEGLNYKVFSRPEILAVLNAHSNVTHGVLVEFRNYLKSHEVDLSKTMIDLELLNSEQKVAKELMVYIEEKLVASGINPNSIGWDQHFDGGKLLALWCFSRVVRSYKVYVQIESSFKGKQGTFKVVIKVGKELVPISKNALYNLFRIISTISSVRLISLNKSARFQTGKNTATLAVLQNPFKTNEQGEIDIDAFVQTLITLGKVIEAAV